MAKLEDLKVLLEILVQRFEGQKAGFDDLLGFFRKSKTDQKEKSNDNKNDKENQNQKSAFDIGKAITDVIKKAFRGDIKGTFGGIGNVFSKLPDFDFKNLAGIGQKLNDVFQKAAKIFDVFKGGEGGKSFFKEIITKIFTGAKEVGNAANAANVGKQLMLPFAAQEAKAGTQLLLPFAAGEAEAAAGATAGAGEAAAGAAGGAGLFAGFAALLTNPITIVIAAIIAATAATIALGAAALKASESLLDSNRYLEKWNAQIAQAFGISDYREALRNIQSGEARGDRLAGLLDAVNDFKDAIRPITDFFFNVSAGILEVIVRIMTAILDVLDSIRLFLLGDFKQLFHKWYQDWLDTISSEEEFNTARGADFLIDVKNGLFNQRADPLFNW